MEYCRFVAIFKIQQTYIKPLSVQVLADWHFHCQGPVKAPAAPPPPPVKVSPDSHTASDRKLPQKKSSAMLLSVKCIQTSTLGQYLVAQSVLSALCPLALIDCPTVLWLLAFQKIKSSHRFFQAKLSVNGPPSGPPPPMKKVSSLNCSLFSKLLSLG